MELIQLMTLPAVGLQATMYMRKRLRLWKPPAQMAKAVVLTKTAVRVAEARLVTSEFRSKT